MSDDRDQKTEAPTPRRIQKAFEEGQIGFSSDLMGGLILLIGVAYFWIFGSVFFDALKNVLRLRLLNFEELIHYPDRLPEAVVLAFASVVGIILGLLAPLFCVALLSGGLQTNFNITFKPLEMKLDRFNPITGWKKVISMRAVVRGITAIVKTAVVGGVCFWLIQSQVHDISASGMGTLAAAVSLTTQLALSISMTIAALMVIVGVADLAFQKWKQNQDLRMSMKDIRDEHRDDQGDPMLKARMRRLQAEMAQRSIAKEVPEATVVITNPTHYAVALKFDRNQNPVPIVVAKGADHLAKKIIELAREHKVPVVERKPVARYLYHKVPVGKSIPFEMYQAVAEIINFINRLRKAA